MITLAEKFDLKLFENQMRDFYINSDYPLKINEFLNNSNNFKEIRGFVDGPPTMNGEPHLGHLRGRIIKDLWYRKSTLQKKRVIFRPGWDSQGLPVELQAEKVLGLTGNKTENLQRVGIKKIVETCKKIILDYNEKWVNVDRLLGMSFEFDRGYWTYTDSYIEREWSYIKKAYHDGILTEWYRVVAYCPSCQTSLSNSEINQSYEEVQDPSFYYKVKLQDSDNYLIVWTTMPFTLVTDEMVGVNPKSKYFLVKVKFSYNNDNSSSNIVEEKWIVSEDRWNKLAIELKINSFDILDTFYGKDLDGKFYIHPIVESIPGLKELASKKIIHFVVAEEFVDVTTGSGIVHLSPANGEQDFEIATRRNIPIFAPIDDKASFTKEAGKYSGLFVRDADNVVINDMSKAGATVKISKLIHKYPTCWRSHHKLVWLARKEYFYMLDKLKEMPIDAASKVNYYYEQPKNRFLEIIREKVPWCISRERVWGTPLPIWKCNSCNKKQGFFSRKEIINNAVHLPDGQNFELHRPWIDHILIKCSNCQSDMVREPFVLDTWHNSGSAPYASFTDKEYDDFLPAEFLTEGIDQTRGWAYTLLILNVILNYQSNSPFQSFLFTGHVLDEKGNKMSKSLGNVIDAHSLLSQTSVDLIRLYLVWKSSPIESINFNLKELSSRPHQILSTLFYLHVYYQQNSLYDKFRYNVDGVELLDDKNASLTTADRWILTKLEKLVVNSNKSINNCRFHEMAHYIEDFIINSLSQTYVPLIRYDLWSDDIKNKERRFTVYSILYTCLKTLDILLHPICPYITEYLYQCCFGKLDTILMEKWPENEDYAQVSDPDLESSFDTIKNISSISYSLRNRSQLKRRWPLESAYIYYRNKHLSLGKETKEILVDQMNVDNIFLKELKYSNEAEKIIELLRFDAPIIPSVEINRRTVAKRVKSDINKLMQKFESVDIIKVIEDIVHRGTFILNYDNEKKDELTVDDLNFSYKPADNFILAEKDDLIIILNTSRNEELITKGLVKDLARNIQQLRKELGYNPTEILSELFINNLSDEDIGRLEKYAPDIKNLVRVNQINLSSAVDDHPQSKMIELDGREIKIYIC